MNKLDILKNINVLNLILLMISMVMFGEMVYPLLNAEIKVLIPERKNAVTNQDNALARESAPTQMDYAVVVEKNMFHPERRMPLEKKEAQIIVRPEIIYYGSIITKEKKIAYIEDKKNPYSTPGRGKRQMTVSEGAAISGYTLKEVNPETLVLVHGDDKMVVNLRDQKDRKREAGTTNIQVQLQSKKGQGFSSISRPSYSTENAPPPMPPKPKINLK